LIVAFVVIVAAIIVVSILLAGSKTIPPSTPTMAIMKESSYQNQSYTIIVMAISVSDISLEEVGVTISGINSPNSLDHYADGTPWIAGNFTMNFEDVNHDSYISAGDKVLITFTEKHVGGSFGIGIRFIPTGGMMAFGNIEN
jgi:FlaG/FlaF family flagellin (archaellin)